MKGLPREAVAASVLAENGDGRPRSGSDPSADPCYKHHVIALARIPVRMTVGEFLIWDSQDGYRNELVDGEPRDGAGEHGLGGLIIQ